MANAHILEFSRFEFKYVLHKTQREAVEAELNYFMELDPLWHKKKTTDMKSAVYILMIRPERPLPTKLTG